MRIIPATLTAAAVLSMSFGVAQAADAVDTIPQAPEANDTYLPATANWAGGYGGVEGSFDWGRFQGVNTQNDRGLGFSFYGGYNFQSDSLVYGLEGDIGYSGREVTNAGTRTKQGLDGSIRARLGVDVNPFMLYGTGGLAAANHTVSNAGGSDSRTLYGWTAGVGTEAKLTDNIIGRLEYRYTDFGRRTFTPGAATVSSGFDEHSVKVGIGYKF